MYSESSATNMKYFTKRIIKTALGRDHLIRSDIDLPKIRIGTNYGGWFIHDRILRNIDNPLILSFGIGDDISFDLIMIDKYGATVHAFDPTPISIDWLKGQTVPSKFHAHPIGLAATNGEIEFGLPLQDDWDSFSVLDLKKGSIRLPVNSLSQISSDLKITSADVDVLKMDIEGAEYEVIHDMEKIGYKPGQILVEFHYHHSGPASAKDVVTCIEKLRSMGYLVFDVSPWGREFSLIRKDLVQ